jgi:hypothetical protein
MYLFNKKKSNISLLLCNQVWVDYSDVINEIQIKCCDSFPHIFSEKIMAKSLLLFFNPQCLGCRYGAGGMAQVVEGLPRMQI